MFKFGDLHVNIGTLSSFYINKGKRDMIQIRYPLVTKDLLPLDLPVDEGEGWPFV
jgi:hypothetical protein